MMKFLLICLLPLLIDATYYADLKGQETCDYKNEGRIYICNHITNVFPKIYYGNYNLNCKDCHLRVFRKQVFPYENNLVAMNLTGSDIEIIESNAFEMLPTLQYIYLAHNKLRNISSNAFYSLRQVYELHLEHNDLSELQPKFLNGFEANTIILSHNKLAEIVPNIFEGLFGVMTLDLSSNKITTLHRESFNHLKGIEYLDLQNNSLCHVPLGTFKHLRLLKELNLSRNKFKQFNYGIFSGMQNLMALNLSHNLMVEFEASMLIPLDGLVVLDISGNGLNYLEGIPLHVNAPSLRRLGISDNMWSCVGLMNLVQYLKSIHVDIIEHDKYDITNIKGIACTDKPITDQKIPFDVFYKVAKRFTDEAYNYC